MNPIELAIQKLWDRSDDVSLISLHQTSEGWTLKYANKSKFRLTSYLTLTNFDFVRRELGKAAANIEVPLNWHEVALLCGIINAIERCHCERLHG